MLSSNVVREDDYLRSQRFDFEGGIDANQRAPKHGRIEYRDELKDHITFERNDGPPSGIPC